MFFAVEPHYLGPMRNVTCNRIAQIKMTIKLNDNRTLESIENEFHEAFAYLKLKFVTKRPTRVLGDFNHEKASAHLEINENITVSQLAERFQTLYGLSVQFFRKSGRSWLETKATEEWTLAKQNMQGKVLSQLN